MLDAAVRPGETIAILGGAGVGKTLLLLELERHWKQRGRNVAFIENGELATGEEAEDIILIDEAARLSDTAIQRIAARTDQVAVLACLPGFAQRLRGVEFLPVALTALEPDEIAPYLALRLNAMGDPPARFSSEAIKALGSSSGGVPRLLNLLAGSSVFTAGLEGSAAITASHARSAAQMHDLPVPALDRVPDDAIAPTHEPAGARASAPAAPRASQLHTMVPAPAPLAEEAPAPPREQRTPAWVWGVAAVGVVVAAGLVVGLGSDGHEAAAPERQAGLAAAPAPAPAAAPIALPTAPPTAPPAAPALADAAPALPVVEAPRGEPVAATDAEAPGLAGLPGSPVARVVLVHPQGDAPSAGRANRLMAALRQAGLRVAAPFPVQQAEEGDRLRYFFLEDRATAASVASLAGHPSIVPQLATLAAGVPLPRPGTVEWALPRGAAVPPAVAPPGVPQREPPQREPPPAPPVAAVLRPAAGSVLDAAQWPIDVALAWAVPVAGARPCCFVEVQSLATGGDAATGAAPVWREVFSGYATEADRLVVTLGAPGLHAWRVLHVSPRTARYTAGPWSSFTVRAPQ